VHDTEAGDTADAFEAVVSSRMYGTEVPDLGSLAERFDHISVAVRSISGALPLVSLLEGVFHDGGIHRPGGFRWAQFDLPSSGRLELIEPLDPDETSNFLSRYLARNGEGVHHVTLKVGDIQRAIERAEDLGLEVVEIDLSGDSWKEAFIHPKSANGVLVQIAEWTDRPPSGRSLEDVIGGSDA
jgi:methylmalonyl-CoA/ethylmalonyl-CoA epimerase